MYISATIVKNRLGCKDYDDLDIFIKSNYLNVPQPVNIDDKPVHWQFDKETFDKWHKETLKNMEDVLENFFILREQ